MKIFLDDEREAPEGWIRVRSAVEAVELLATGDVTVISLDHDLGEDARGTGYDVVLWIEEVVDVRGFRPPVILIHSANLSARLKMEAGIESIRRLAGM